MPWNDAKLGMIEQILLDPCVNLSKLYRAVTEVYLVVVDLGPWSHAQSQSSSYETNARRAWIRIFSRPRVARRLITALPDRVPFHARLVIFLRLGKVDAMAERYNMERPYAWYGAPIGGLRL